MSEKRIKYYTEFLEEEMRKGNYIGYPEATVLYLLQFIHIILPKITKAQLMEHAYKHDNILMNGFDVQNTIIPLLMTEYDQKKAENIARRGYILFREAINKNFKNGKYSRVFDEIDYFEIMKDLLDKDDIKPVTKEECKYYGWKKIKVI